MSDLKRLNSLLSIIKEARLNNMSDSERAKYFARQAKIKKIFGNEPPPLVVKGNKILGWHPNIDEELGYVPLPLKYTNLKG